MNIVLTTVLLMLIRARAQGTAVTMAEQIQIICNYDPDCVDLQPDPIADIMVYEDSLATSVWTAYNTGDPSTLLPCPSQMFVDPIINELCDFYQDKNTITSQCQGAYAEVCEDGGVADPPCCDY